MSGWAAKLLVPKKPVKTPEPPSDKPRPDPVAAVSERYNGSEVVEVLSDRYIRDLAAAQRDKRGEKIQVYRSLHATSAWTTQGAVTRKNKREEEGRFNLVDEVNRAIARAKKKD